MLRYDKYPLNIWVYGLSVLIILILPLLIYLGEANSLGDFFQSYLSVMLFPYELSSEYLFQIPYLGILLAIASFVLHVHVYCTIIERLSILFRSRN